MRSAANGPYGCHRGIPMKTSLPCSLIALSLLFVHSTAHAQDCSEDSECAPEEYCDRYPSSTDQSSESSGAAGDPCPSEQECGEFGGASTSSDEKTAPKAPDEDLPQAEGRCERGGRECTSDSQCRPDYYCALNETNVACTKGEDCVAAQAQADAEQTGRCEHAPYICKKDTDCPEPTSCVKGECLYQLQACESDAVCGEAYQCISMREGSGSDSVGSDDDPGSADPSTASEAPTPENASEGEDIAAIDAEDVAGKDPAPDAADAEKAEAERVAADAAEAGELICLPAPVACESDAQCPSGWNCVLLDDDLPGFAGLERGCLPPGLVAVLAGDLDVEGGDGASDSNSTGEESDPDLGIPGIDTNDSDASNLSGTQGGTEGSAGCTVGGFGEPGEQGLGALLLGLGLFLRYRRTQPAGN